MGSCHSHTAGLEVRPIGWTRRLEAGLRKTATPQEVAWQKRRYEAGEIQPVGLFCGDKLAWSALAWIDDGPDGLEVVISGAAGELGKSVDMGVTLAFEGYAAGKGARFIRFHTLRPGFARVALSLGYRNVEYVLKKQVA